MSVFFSVATMGFYPLGIPVDAKESDFISLSDAEYDELRGQQLMIGSDGRPALYVAPAPTFEQMQTGVILQRDYRLRIATLRIDPLQDAADLGEANDTEAALLILWKKYRVALNRIQDQSGYPESVQWPSSPDTL